MSTLTQQLYSQSHWLADGSQTVWNFSFSGGYISRDHVRAYTRGPLEDDPRIDIVLTETNFVGDFQLLIEPAVTAGHTLIIYRDTPKDLPLVDFADGANINEVSLDIVAKQSVFIAAESADFLGITTTADLAALAATAIANAGAAAASAINADASADAAAASASAANASAVSAAASSAAATSSAAAASAASAAAVASAISSLLAEMGDTTSPLLGAGLVGNATFIASSRTVLKAVVPSRNPVVYLNEVARQGEFRWEAGNFSAHIAADTQEGVYILSNLSAATVGAWVRVTGNVWNSDWFGVPADPASGGGGGSEVQGHTQLTALINIGLIVKPSKVCFGSKIITLGAEVPEWSWQVVLEGARGAQGTIVNKRYTASTPTRGIFAFNDHGFRMIDMTFRATSGSLGSGISAILTLNSPAAGRTFLTNCYVSVGDFCNYSLYINGTTNVTLAGPCYRGVWIQGGEFFGAAIASVALVGVHHVFASGTFVATSGGTGTIGIQFAGDAVTYNDDVQWTGVIDGVTNINWLSRSNFVSPQLGGINVDANSTDVMWTGPRVSGVVTNSAAAGEFVFTWDGTVVASGGTSAAGWRRWGSGRIEQWGSATTSGGAVSAQNWPLAFGSTNIFPTCSAVSDQGVNIIGNTQIIPSSATQYAVKMANFNYSTGAYAGASSAVRWQAIGTL